MKGIPLSDEEYISTQEMLDSFRPERLHGHSKKVTGNRVKRAKLAHLSGKAGKQTANVKKE